MSKALVRDLMTPNPFCVDRKEVMGTARRTMVERRVRHLVVVDREGILLGIVNQEDLLRAVWRLSTDNDEASWTDAPIGDALPAEVGPTRAETEAVAAARRMLAGKHTALAVVDDDGRPVGILTEADFLRWAIRDLD